MNSLRFCTFAIFHFKLNIPQISKPRKQLPTGTLRRRLTQRRSIAVIGASSRDLCPIHFTSLIFYEPYTLRESTLYLIFTVLGQKMPLLQLSSDNEKKVFC